jgi:hypothetical protein
MILKKTTISPIINFLCVPNGMFFKGMYLSTKTFKNMCLEMTVIKKQNHSVRESVFGIHCNMMLSFLTQTLQNPPDCSSTFLTDPVIRDNFLSRAG